MLCSTNVRRPFLARITVYPHLNSVLFFHRVELTSDHTIHVLCYNDHAHFMSAEVSLWLWESDQLQLKLRQVSKPVWGRLLREQQARQLFRELRSDKGTRVFLKRGQRDVNIYNLEE